MDLIAKFHDFEHFHATTHSKGASSTQLDYARSFVSSIKEPLKRISNMSYCYHTSTNSWYPVPKNAVTFAYDLKLESLPPI